MIGVICCQQALYIQNRERYYSHKSFLSQETERIQEHKDRAISDWLNLFGHYLWVAFTQLLPADSFIVVRTRMSVVIAMSSTEQSTASAVESCKSNPFTTNLASIFSLLLLARIIRSFVRCQCSL